ncbi:MAG: tetratricopeptide repeat protein [Gemmatimonadota bacterium]
MTRLTTAALAGLVVLGACSTRGDLERMEETMVAEFRELNERQDSLAREVRDLRLAVLDSLSAREDEALGARGELGRRLDQFRDQLGRIAELTGQNQRTMARLREEMAARAGGDTASGSEANADDGEADDGEADDGEGDDGEADDGEGDDGEADDGEGDDGEGDDGEGDDGEGDDDSATRLYETALEQFRRGAHGTARSGLREFLSEHPDHDLAPDARYYVAETYARGDQPREAIEAYGRVVELHPGSRRAATALYKSGVLEAERGNLEDARVYFSRVVEGYPDSDEAELARERLEGGDG